jgi:hypothetical protein
LSFIKSDNKIYEVIVFVMISMGLKSLKCGWYKINYFQILTIKIRIKIYKLKCTICVGTVTLIPAWS